MESEVVHSPSETSGGISSRGIQFPAWRRASSTRARFFLIWFRKTQTQKIARGYSDSGELETALCREGERAWSNKNTPSSSELLSLSPPGPVVTSAPRLKVKIPD